MCALVPSGIKLNDCKGKKTEQNFNAYALVPSGIKLTQSFCSFCASALDLRENCSLFQFFVVVRFFF
jgi:hypothetical protein